MTVQSVPFSVNYTGDGIVTDFDYTFYVIKDAHLEVYLDDALLTQDVEYTLANTADPDNPGGTVTFLAAPTGSILITRNVPAEQLSDYKPYDRFPAERVEEDLDELTMMIQQLYDAVGTGLDGNKMAYDPDADPRVWIGRALRINNIADPQENQDALTLGYAIANQFVGAVGPAGLAGPAGFGVVVADDAALAAILGPLDGEVALVRDNGFIWAFDATDVQPASAEVIKPTDNTPGSWLRKSEVAVNASWFLTDSGDQAANLQAALDHAAAVGGHLFVYAPDLQMDSGVTIDISKCSVTFFGTKIDASAMSTGYLFDITGGVDDIQLARRQVARSVSGFIAIGPGSGSTVDLIRLQGLNGNSSGPSRSSIHHFYAYGFRHMISVGANSFLQDIHNFGMVDFIYGINAPDTLDGNPVTNAGERMNIRAGLFGGEAGVGTAMYLQKGEWFITQTSFDTLEKVVVIEPGATDAPRFVASLIHLEAVNNNAWTTTPFVINNTGTGKGIIDIQQSNITRGNKTGGTLPEYIFENNAPLGVVNIDGFTRMLLPDTTSGYLFGGVGEFYVPSIYKDTDVLNNALDIFGEPINRLADGGFELSSTGNILDHWMPVIGADDVTIEIDTVNFSPFGGGSQSLKITGNQATQQVACIVPVQPGQATFAKWYYEVSESAPREHGWCRPTIEGGKVNLGRKETVGAGPKNDQSWTLDQIHKGQDRCPSWATHWYFLITLGSPAGETYSLDDMIVNIV